jgi:hypothetical protein
MTTPEMTIFPDSSRIRAAGWRAGSMYVIFTTGHVWMFGTTENPVPKDLFDGLLDAPSKGSYFYPRIQHYSGECLSTGEKQEPMTDLMVASPVYLVLLQTRKALKMHPGTKLRYALWTITGKKATWEPDTMYQKCLAILKEANPTTDDLDGAIALAKARKV